LSKKYEKDLGGIFYIQTQYKPYGGASAAQ
jgi:hypothetical protein